MERNNTVSKGSIEMIILCLLREGEKYGYEMLQEIENRSGGIIRMNEGSLYVPLYRMVKEGTVTEERRIVGKRMRVYYRIEASGYNRLAELREEHETMIDGMWNLLQLDQKMSKFNK